jgi:lipid II:glycine glycyltransferase (peptidoglycan interpeptide bridge formation enzyme)
MSFLNPDTCFVSFQPDPVKWKIFVDEHPQSTIFHQPEMMNLFSSVPSIHPVVIAIQTSTGDILSLLTLTIHGEKGLRYFFSKRSIAYCGPLTKKNNEAYLHPLMEAYLKYIQKQSIIYTEIRNHFPAENIKSLMLVYGFRFIDHLNILIDLALGKEEISKQLHKKRASNIRRAVKRGVTIQEIEPSGFGEAYNLIRKTYSRISVPEPSPELFIHAKKYLNHNIKILGAFWNNRMIASRIYLLHNKTVYDWYAGSDEKYLHLHPNDLLPWHMMVWSLEQGYSMYDFCGAGKPGKPYGVRTYKQRFGGNLVNYGRYLNVHKPLLYKIGSWAITYYKYFKRL